MITNGTLLVLFQFSGRSNGDDYFLVLNVQEFISRVNITEQISRTVLGLMPQGVSVALVGAERETL